MEPYAQIDPLPVHDLTFDMISDYLKEKHVRLDLTRNIKDDNGLLTDYAKMISDQCPWHLDYEDRDGRTVFEGPLPVQVEECVRMIVNNSPLFSLRSRMGLCSRFPALAVREALVNAAIHFDSSFDTDISVTLSDNNLRIESPGSIYLYAGRTGYRPRNPGIAEIFMRVKYASLKNRGLVAIKNSYMYSGVVPRFSSTKDSFVVNLPPIESGDQDSDRIRTAICDYLRDNSGSSIERLSNDLMLSPYRSRRVLDSLESEGTTFSMGVGKNKMVFLNEHQTKSTGRLEERTHLIPPRSVNTS